MAATDRIGSVRKRDVCPRGLILNPKTAEAVNVEFAGFEGEENVLFRLTSDATKARDLEAIWKNLDYYPKDFDELFELAHIKDIGAIQDFAKKHGPLFGAKFDEYGILREPIDMWYEAACYMDLGLKLQASIDTKDWRRLDGREVSFEVEYAMLDKAQEESVCHNGAFVTRDNQFVAYCAKAVPNYLSPGYRDFILNKLSGELWGWHEESWDGPGVSTMMFYDGYCPEMGLDNKTLQDWLDTHYDATHPSLAVAVTFNSLDESNRAFNSSCRVHSAPLANNKLSDQMGPKLCRLLSEALISLHCRNVSYGWQKHQFKPIFREHLRYLWHVYSIYRGHETLDYCVQCGRPYMKSRSDKKYCSDRCRKDAHR